ncbi:rna-directed dna polymerase from mobile element hypothetical protein [Limosa lapponica baueri]|uniref:Rna-directed dna polymerase from mobile element jockey-like n=1 Tax=Limosa lapponica baueri TaxID=1758121 RepID=A0A2I0TJ51_LIMLA|nr:rna-directed dna polymerase from mobile element hypothetical protein [Limosa lapponica baueri]
MGNKQEELEAFVQQESYDIVAIMKTWWDDSHDWSAAMDGCKLFRRDSRVGCSLSTQTPEIADRGGEQIEAPVIQREMVRDLLQNLDINKSMGPDGIHLRELAEGLTEPLSIIYQQSWQTGEV